MGTVTSILKNKEYDYSEATYAKAAVGSNDVIISISASGEKASNSRISTQSLYLASNEIKPELAKAFQLLPEGVEFLNKAISNYIGDDLISSDDYTNRLQALLPELFCCRSLSDSFGAIINATYHSIANMQGTPLNMAQLSAVKNLLSRLYSEPFIKFEEAVEEIMTLEDAGLEVEPSNFKYMADLLSE